MCKTILPLDPFFNGAAVREMVVMENGEDILPADDTPMVRLTTTDRIALRAWVDPATPPRYWWAVPVYGALLVRDYLVTRAPDIPTGWDLAGVLRDSFVPDAHNDLRQGWDVLRMIDRCAGYHGVYVFVGEVRLTTRLAELGWTDE